MFKADQRVTHPVHGAGYVTTGDVYPSGYSTDYDQISVMFDDGHGTWVNVHELSLEPRPHVCAPFVGIIHIEPTCVYCNQYMTQDQVAAYVKEKISL